MYVCVFARSDERLFTFDLRTKYRSQSTQYYIITRRRSLSVNHNRVLKLVEFI